MRIGAQLTARATYLGIPSICALSAYAGPACIFQARRVSRRKIRLSKTLTTREEIMKRLIALLMIAGSAMTALAGCNTISGAGEDVSAAGHAVTNTADKSKPN